MAEVILRAQVRRIWARLQAREDPEHEQALIRIGVAFVMYFYLLAIPHRRRTTTSSSAG